MDLQEQVTTDSLPEQGTLVRTACDRHRISALVQCADAAQLWDYAQVMAKNKTSDRHLAVFVREQIDNRDTVVEAAISAACPGHSEDVAYRITLFVLGLLAGWSNVSTPLKAALYGGRAIVDVQLLEASVSVRIVDQTGAYESAH